MTSNDMEEYYQKVIHLQEKLRQSEEERLRLEMKFNEMLQTMKEEEQVHFKKLRSKYKQFLEEDRQRQQRNDKILEALDRIENRTVVWEAKTEKFKAFRRRYHDNVKQTGRTRYESSPERPPEPKHEYYRETVYPEVQPKPHDTKEDIMEKYLQSISSQKCKDELTRKTENKPPPEAKYSNLGNINSIYWKPPRSGEKGDLEKTDPLDSTQLKNTKDMENALKQNTPSAPNPKSYEYADYKTKTFTEDFNKPTVRYNDFDFEKQPSPDTFISKPSENTDYKYTPPTYREPLNNRRPSQQQDNPKQNPQEVHEELQRILQQKTDEARRESLQKPTSSIPSELKQHPLPPLQQQIQPAPRHVPPREILGIKQETQPRAVDSFETPHLEKDPAVVVPQPKLNTQPELITTKSPVVENLANKPKEFIMEQKVPPPVTNYPVDQSLNEPATNITGLTDPLPEEQLDSNESYNPTPQQDDVTDQYPQQYYDEVGQPLQQYEEVGQPLPQYDENGQLLQQYYDENQQLPSEYYDENGQPLQQYYEEGQPMQQYDEHGQPVPQYDESGQPMIQYDESGQPIAQYDENGQLVAPYDQTGQPLPQYDETGQPLLQYDENGQPIAQYDETGQPLQQYYDENGQPIQYYAGEEAAQQYDENGQPIQQQYADQPYEDQQQYYEQDQQEALGQQENLGQLDQDQNSAEGLGEQQEPLKVEPKSNVLDMLDTDTESTKQDTKISNGSDFDFSNG